MFSTIIDFSSFLQFIAGIYLVFLYDRIFKLNPLYTQVESIKDVLNGLVNEFQVNLSEDDYRRVSLFFDKREAKWNGQFASLKKMSFISFLFSLFLLFYVGLEKDFLAQGWEQALIVPSIVTLGYESLIFFFPSLKTKWIKSYRFIGILFVLMIMYVILFCAFDREVDILPEWNTSAVHGLALLASSFGMLLYASNLCVKCFKYIYIKQMLKKIQQKVNLFMLVKLGIKKATDMSRKDQKALLQKAIESGSNINDVIDDVMKDEFREMFNKIIRK